MVSVIFKSERTNTFQHLLTTKPHVAVSSITEDGFSVNSKRTGHNSKRTGQIIQIGKKPQ